MTQIGRPMDIPAHLGRRRAVSFVITLVGLALSCPTSSEGARLTHYLTSADLAGRMVLDQNGEPIQLPTTHDRHPALAAGSVPTYLAIPLYGGERLSGSIPAIDTGSPQGESPVGPLDFDSLVKANLDATLEKTRLAIVETSTQNYLVEFLPRRVGSGSGLKNAADSAGSTVGSLVNLLDTGQNQLNKVTQSGMNELEKFLHVSAKTSTLTPSLNLEAQVLTGEITPAAVPEPSMWLVFVGLIGAIIVRQRRRAA